MHPQHGLRRVGDLDEVNSVEIRGEQNEASAIAARHR
jgi:hypothetical protein